MVQVSFKIGAYKDTLECDMVPISVCHFLLGRPWQFDCGVIHNGRTNHYIFKLKGKEDVLRPMSPSHVIADKQASTHHGDTSEREFADVFPDDLPPGLPPINGIEHRIDLIPGAPLPNNSPYRFNPNETKEIQRQVQQLIDNGHAPHSSP
ncbi:uncharacterized protein [Aegilops tauschii subsp. strangulata]|uniref:uncharacterized protein n=1 Tax=Aegilops tauschii subsp. strangulata TaxID=200361 RepID=UPI003CC8C069